jgi:hypothetical protein
LWDLFCPFLHQPLKMSFFRETVQTHITRCTCGNFRWNFLDGGSLCTPEPDIPYYTISLLMFISNIYDNRGGFISISSYPPRYWCDWSHDEAVTIQRNTWIPWKRLLHQHTIVLIFVWRKHIISFLQKSDDIIQKGTSVVMRRGYDLISCTSIVILVYLSIVKKCFV